MEFLAQLENGSAQGIILLNKCLFNLVDCTIRLLSELINQTLNLLVLQADLLNFLLLLVHYFVKSNSMLHRSLLFNVFNPLSLFLHVIADLL